MKTVFWEILKYSKNEVIIRYWRKPSKSDALIVSMPKSSDSTVLKERITDETGLKHFILVYVEDMSESN
jgi:hypothetical protein